MEGLVSIDLSNVLSEEMRQQVIALARLGWPPRRIQQETGIRRETAGARSRPRIINDAVQLFHIHIHTAARSFPFHNWPSSSRNFGVSG